MSVNRILITGAAGFIGGHLARYLSDDSSNQILLVDNFKRGQRDADLESLLVRPNVSLLEADLTNPAAFDQIGRGYNAVYHLAAIIGVKNVMSRPYDVVRVNALSTLNLIDWFRDGGGNKLLFSSTSEAYAWTQQFFALPIPTPEGVPLALTEIGNARSSYAGSKIFGELAVMHGCGTAGKPFTIVRYHNVYGPRMGLDHVIPELYQRVVAGQDPLVVYNPDHSRAFCYVEDAVAATVAAMKTEAADGETINVGNDQDEVTIGELARRILAKVGVKVRVQADQAAHDPIQRRCPDMTKARRLLHFVPKTNLDEGLEQTFAWYGSRVAKP